MDGSEDATAAGWERSSTTRAPNAASSASLAAGRHHDDDDDYCGDADDDDEEEEEEEEEDHLRGRRRGHHRRHHVLRADRLLSSSSAAGAAGALRAPSGGADVSLREWLDQPGRAVDLLECLHIFRQIVEAVSSAHAQGVVVGNVRPSCFVMSPLNRVSFIESASCSTSGSSDSCEDAVGPGRPPRQRRGDAGRAQERASGMPSFAVFGEAEEKEAFPLKQVLLMEMNWYTSPEEAVGGPASFASDIYRLGVLLFELFYAFDTMEEKLRTMSNLRHRVLPPQLLLRWSKEASFCLWLLHPQPNTRPKMSEVLQSEFLNQPTNSLKERDSAIRLREDIEDQELLLDFLLHLQQRKQEVADRLHDIICFLSADIDEVLKQQSILRQNSFSDCKDDHSTAEKLSLSVRPEIDEGSLSSGSRKRFRPELQKPLEEEKNFPSAEGSRAETEKHIQENVLAKSARLMKNFKKLEAAYFSTRCRPLKPSRKQVNKSIQVADSGKGSLVRTEVSSIDDMVSREGNSTGRNNEWVNPFLEGLCKYLAFSKLKVRADLKQGDLLNSLNLVCSMGFDRDKEFFATAGVNKKIKIFEFDSILSEDRDIQYPVVELVNKSKISCICWNSYIKSQIAASDFDGVVQVWDVTRGQVFSEMREHEKRVWSVDFSLADPTKLASGSDDGAVKLWNINQAGSIGTIRTKANVCTVNFQPDSVQTLAVGSADHKIYFYDLRNFRVPYNTLVGHMKTVSYVKYLNSSTIVSASTDNSLKLWDLSTCVPPRALDNPIQTFLGHTNVKNFVGLSVYDGYIATGSETNEVFVYHKAFPMPVLSYKFNNPDPLSGQELDDTSQFVSCVCWRGNSSTLLAASSSGNIKVMEMV